MADAPISVVQQMTGALAVSTALGAVVAVVLNIRRQDLAEELADRELEKQHRESAAADIGEFASAAGQLGSESAYERLAGAYAMAALGDRSEKLRVQCGQVLVGYLRLSSDREGDDEQDLRRIVLTLIVDRLRASALGETGTWADIPFVFDGARFTDADFSGARFKAAVSFKGCVFAGQKTDFSECRFEGGASFQWAQFDSVLSTFWGATFFVGEVRLGAKFASQVTSFERVDWVTVHADFTGAVSAGGQFIGLAHPRLEHADLLADGKPFRGWPGKNFEDQLKG